MESVTEREVASKENLHGTTWLMAHIRMHDLVHSRSEKPLADLWKEYLDELQSAEEIAAHPA